jgi:hypothetical protein
MKDKDQKLLWEAYLTEQSNLQIEYLGWVDEYDQVGWRFSVNGEELPDDPLLGVTAVTTGNILYGYDLNEVYETLAFKIAQSIGKPDAQAEIQKLIMAPNVLPPEKLKQEGEASGAALDRNTR